MSVRRIIHTTTYRYRAPVAFGLHRLVVRPREGHDLQVQELNLHIQPACRVSWHRDLFGNSIAVAFFSEPADLLEFRNDVVVRRRDIASHQGLLEAFPVRFPVGYSPLEEPVVAGYRAAVYPEETHGIAQWTRAHFVPVKGCDAVALVQAMGTWIYRNVQYRRREDRGVQTPLQTLQLASGSCRDMATLLLEAVRSVGLAARFASGYLDSAASAAGRAATHAWTEVYFPEHGWFGFDPTLGEGTSHKHIVTGVSSHPRGVMPVSGSYSGSRELYLDMTVTVKIEPMARESLEIQPDPAAHAIFPEHITS
jgi:transglutaminase-like putative cysteine protease